MIVRISGELVEKKEQSVVINVGGLFYEIIVPKPVLARLDELADDKGHVSLITYHYYQINQSSGIPILIGFIAEIESEFFQQFIKVSGIGPRAAVKALDKPISEITQAIEEGNIKYLKTLSGIGLQRAKEIVAKLQGKVGKYGLIQDSRQIKVVELKTPDWQEEALNVLLQLQYKTTEARHMIESALKQSDDINNTEELLNEIYKQKVKI